MRILTGFYVYGAMVYLLLGDAAIVWHDKWALNALVVGAAGAATSYWMEEFRPEDRRSVVMLAVIISWIFPTLAWASLIFRS